MLHVVRAQVSLPEPSSDGEICVKACSVCCIEKPVDQFYRWNSTRDGRMARCAECSKKAQKNTLRSKEWADRLAQHVGQKQRHIWKVESDITPAFLRELYARQEGRCAWFGVPLLGDIGSGLQQVSLDRLDIDRGYMTNNVALVCKAANLARNAASQEEFEIFTEVLRASLNRRK